MTFASEMEVKKLVPYEIKVELFNKLFIIECKIDLPTFLLTQQVEAEYFIVEFLHLLEMFHKSLLCLLVTVIKLNLSVDPSLFPKQRN